MFDITVGVYFAFFLVLRWGLTYLFPLIVWPTCLTICAFFYHGTLFAFLCGFTGLCGLIADFICAFVVFFALHTRVFYVGLCGFVAAEGLVDWVLGWDFALLVGGAGLHGGQGVGGGDADVDFGDGTALDFLAGLGGDGG